jgi:hypothetical protein
MIVEASYALICLGAAINLTWAIVATGHAIKWHDRYNELISKPFSFWQTRDQIAQINKLREQELESLIKRYAPPIE